MPLLDEIRAALHFQGRGAAALEVVARGAGTVAGLVAALTWQCHIDGRTRLEVDSPLPETTAFDGTHGAYVGPLGLLEPLDLADLDEFRLAAALITGSWLDPRTMLWLDDPVTEGDRIVVRARAGDEPWRQAFRIVCKSTTRRPLRLEVLSGRDTPALEVDDFAPGVFCDMPRRLHWRRGWLTDTVEITHVGPADEIRPYALHDARGERAAYVDPAAPTRARATRSPRGRLPLVRAAVDGLDLGWFLIDTGAGASAIDRAIADRLDLPSVGRTWVLTPTGGEGAAYRRCPGLTVGPVRLPDALLVELDLADISVALGARLVGIFGFDLFAQTMVRLVHSPLTVELFTPCHDVPATWSPVRFEHRVPVLDAVLSASWDGPSATGRVVLDTGSSGQMVLNERVMSQLGRTARRRRGIRGVSGTGSFGVGRLPRIDVAGTRFERCRVLVADGVEGALAGPTTLGSIGWGLFAGREILLDWSRRRIAISSPVSTR